MPAKGMAGMPAGRGGVPGGGRGGGGSSGHGGGGCILQGLFAFYCEDVLWYFYDVWGELVRSHLPSHSHHA
jgi:hypothetical protein